MPDSPQQTFYVTSTYVCIIQETHTVGQCFAREDPPGGTKYFGNVSASERNIGTVWNISVIKRNLQFSLGFEKF